MTDQFGHFVESGPVEPEDDALFSTRRDFVLNLKSIAEHIVGSSQATRSSPMIFGLYGKWGVGKSSALRYIEALIEETAKRENVTVFYSQFDAPLWEQHRNARASMALQILLGSPDVLTKATDLLSQLRHVGADKLLASDGAQWDLQSSVQFLDTLAQYEGAPPMLEHWLREMISEGRATGESRPVYVMFVDDVDRCSAEFTVQLLIATNYWVSARGAGIFFILAASRAHLLESLQQSSFPLGPRNPEEALEKYVHLSVDVPDMLTNPNEIAVFLTKLINATASKVERARITELHDLLRLGPDNDPLSSVFAPLLHPSDGRITPRAVKYRLNTFLAEFKPQANVELTPELVKRWVLKAFWPDFWWRMLWPAETLDQVSQSRILALRKIGQKLAPLWAMDSSLLRAPFEHLASAEGVVLDPIDDPVVAIYLAAEPAWEPPSTQQTGKETQSTRSPDSQDTETGGASRGVGDEEVLETGTASRGDGVGPGVPPSQGDLENEVFLQYLRAKEEETNSNRADALRRTRDVLAIAKLLEDPNSVAIHVGNAALIAERQEDYGLAIELHDFAARSRPNHENINLNYATAVLRAERSDYYDRAEVVINRIKALPGRKQEFRAMTLDLSLRRKNGEEPSALAPAFEELRQRLMQSPNPGDLYRLLNITKATELRWLIDETDLQETCQAVLSNCDTDAKRYRTLKLLADKLFFWGDDLVKETDAARLYLTLLRAGVLPKFGNPTDAEENIAWVLRQHGYNDAGLLIFLDVYRRSAASNWLRRTLALQLNERDEGKAAAAVLLGQEIPGISVEPEELPKDLLSSSERWWANVRWDDSYPVYASKALELLGQAST